MVPYCTEARREISFYILQEKQKNVATESVFNVYNFSVIKNFIRNWIYYSIFFNTLYVYVYQNQLLEGQCHEIFCIFWFSSCVSFPPTPVRRYLQVKMHHQYQQHRRQICHRYQRHWRQILPPVSLVLLIPVANNGNNIRLLGP